MFDLISSEIHPYCITICLLVVGFYSKMTLYSRKHHEEINDQRSKEKPIMKRLFLILGLTLSCTVAYSMRSVMPPPMALLFDAIENGNTRQVQALSSQVIDLNEPHGKQHNHNYGALFELKYYTPIEFATKFAPLNSRLKIVASLAVAGASVSDPDTTRLLIKLKLDSIPITQEEYEEYHQYQLGLLDVLLTNEVSLESLAYLLSFRAIPGSSHSLMCHIDSSTRSECPGCRLFPSNLQPETIKEEVFDSRLRAYRAGGVKNLTTRIIRFNELTEEAIAILQFLETGEERTNFLLMDQPSIEQLLRLFCETSRIRFADGSSLRKKETIARS